MAKRNRSRSGAQIECPLCGRKLRGEKGLKMHVAAEHDQQGGLTEYELNVLRAFRADTIGTLVAGAALSHAFEVLSGSGYLTLSGKITEKGMAVLS
ncbi:hypothetical protein [Pelagibacterium halotolerans]|uniref:C2H2-type domain-containing protein n=1 Tax=Pelagibacterium halotolerans (strain DSM 22347 / JCM 15775 / CGMCC 1.7692 / B2) TaxID=1082931 RepID=G4RDF0_PELHB|nr:hypothetical protein [Pelagibacterium halotolerans]AEQ50776.1 hypothetical protein KKY_737 [Pelagibacterium halotolerans B2]QJR19307.1 hypothetical protein HKM20_13175 [Pelagibacterium halotolerans]SDZ95560.1 hypothetical protein SAMN05428936_101663 [Pelagibacterium halotolerans]